MSIRANRRLLLWSPTERCERQFISLSISAQGDETLRSLSPLKRCLPVEIGAASDGVVGEMLHGLLVAVILRRIGPEQVAHGAEGWRLLEPV